MSWYITSHIENCGYNKTFLSVHMRELVENATWGEELGARIQ
jgi:hypothetical protein